MRDNNTYCYYYYAILLLRLSDLWFDIAIKYFFFVRLPVNKQSLINTYRSCYVSLIEMVCYKQSSTPTQSFRESKLRFSRLLWVLHDD